MAFYFTQLYGLYPLLLNINEIVTIIETKELNESINENKNIQMSQIDKPKASTYAKNIRPLLKTN